MYEQRELKESMLRLVLRLDANSTKNENREEMVKSKRKSRVWNNFLGK